MDNMEKGSNVDIGKPMTTPTRGTFTGDWDSDRIWWQENYTSRPYVSSDLLFEDYEPAYRFGYGSVSRYRGKNWDTIEHTLRADWDRFEGKGESTWESVKEAVHDAWDNLTGKK